ncbi:hypothetical protein SCHPADRAFT_626588 [Schizopora paradoxa]|uniref:Uncharacterized protein n=1 Tax=Schizopora paradoxa TaxID=27342 RepID=A0A0H2R7Y9_9AGAM|nr:hypothetical protein SCHPADRAFT_626588 [Schizopora paradoxa]
MTQRAFCSVSRIASYDSDATADNLLGGGRNLGVLFSFLGYKFESLIGRFAESRGHGPKGVGKKIAHLRQHDSRSLCQIYVDFASGAPPVLSKVERKKLVRYCRKLIRYSRSKTDTTAIAANNEITELVIYDPLVQWVFLGILPNIEPVIFSLLQYDLVDLRVDPEMDPLLSSSRKALISVIELEIQKLWSSFYVAVSLDGPTALDALENWLALNFFTAFFKLLGNSDMAFLNMRHLAHAMHTFSLFQCDDNASGAIHFRSSSQT